MIRPIRTTRDVAAVLGPIAFVLVPKCPLCLLPLLAAAGIAAPPNPVLNAIIGAAVLGWGTLLFSVTHSLSLRACGVILAITVVAGRFLALSPLTWIGITLMVALAFVSSLRCRKLCSAGGQNATEHHRDTPIPL
jgi:hypothetical protein